MVGVKLAPLVIHDALPLDRLAGKKVAVDGCNLLFKYITKIRAKNQILTNSEGDPMSHIIGFFYFCINVIERKIRPIFVFDGYPPKEKRQKSPEKIDRLVKLWRMYNRNAVSKKILLKDPLFLYDKFISDLQEFLRLMGLPVVRGLSEGEAQGTRLVSEGKAYGMISRDLDSLLFGCPRTFREVHFKNDVYPNGMCTTISLRAQLDRWRVTHQQLVDVALLIGTDYNEGIKGIGPKKALRLVLDHGRLEDIPDFEYPFDIDRLRSLFLKPATIKATPIFRAPNSKQLEYYLRQKGLSSQRINRGIRRLQVAFRHINIKQSSLMAFV